MLKITNRLFQSFGDVKNRTRRILVYSFFAIILYIADSNGLIFSHGLNRAAAVFQYELSSRIIETTQTWNSWRAWFDSWYHVRQENIKLREQITTMQEWRLEALRLRIENRDLLNLLDIDTNFSNEIAFIAYGRVTSFSSRVNPYSFVVSTADRNLLIQRNAIVLQGEGLAGRVIESGKGWINVLHVGDVASRIPVETLRSGDRAILTGNNSSTPYLDFYSETHQMQENDLLVTSGHGGIFPAGLPIGHIRFSDQGRIDVSLLAAFERLGWLSILEPLEDYDF